MGAAALGFGSARAAPRRSDAGIPSYELFLHFVFFCHGIKSTWYISDFMSFKKKRKTSTTFGKVFISFYYYLKMSLEHKTKILY
jgi:hypothetical protein